MSNVLQAVSEQVSNVVVQAIKDLPALFARLDKPHLSQSAHVV